MAPNPNDNEYIQYLKDKNERDNHPEIDFNIIDKYFREFEELNMTTSSIYDLGDSDILIILKDGTNLTSLSQVRNKDDILYLSERLTNEKFLNNRFCNFTSLKSAIIHGNVSDIISMYCAFQNCHSLEFAYFVGMENISKLTNISAAFMGCTSLSDISFLKHLNVSNVRNFESTFQGCYSLNDISALKSWDVSNGENMHATFALCPNITSLNGLKSWDVRKVETMESMFHGCESLVDISDLSEWRLDNIKNLFEMFRECNSLENTDGLRNWNINEDVNVTYMFKNLDKLEKPTWYALSTREIEKYIKCIDDEKSLIEIIYNNPNYICKKIATEHIRSKSALKKIIKDHSDAGVLEAAIKNENLNDEQFLMDFIGNNRHDFAMRVIAFNQIKDNSLLAEILKEDFLMPFKRMAVERITDKNYLLDIINNENDEELCALASKRLQSLD